MQVGIIGLIEEEWLTTLGAVDTTTMVYQDFVEVGRKFGQEMKVRGRGGRLDVRAWHFAEMLVPCMRTRGHANQPTLLNQVSQLCLVVLLGCA